MRHQNRRESRKVQTRERREARAQRILDAASTLILHDGYDETTIEDIAREADVGKGTLYLHWTTREALFAALIDQDIFSPLFVLHCEKKRKEEETVWLNN